jgi:hypothetical protein
MIQDLSPMLLTTTGDLPATADMKYLVKVLSEVRGSFSPIG